MKDLNELRDNSIKWCLQEGDANHVAEAIAICIASLTDKKGKRIRVYLSEDYEEHIRLCKQIAEMLMKGGLK